jgi:GH24 family phage-related lysozyme (muramidase)
MINIEKMLTSDEGKRLKVYICTGGYKTVGIGHNLDADRALHILERELQLGDYITESECTALFKYDLDKVKAGIVKKIPFFIRLHEYHQAMLINMTFQMGLKGLLKFKNMLHGLEEGDIYLVSSSIRSSLYYEQTKNRAMRMLKLAQGIIPPEYV